MSDPYSQTPLEALGDAYLAEYDVKSEHDLIINILSTSYDLKTIQHWFNTLCEVCSKEYTHDSAVKICRTLGRRIEKLKIYKHDFTFVNVRHLAGTLQFCIDLIELGYSIHLIESISSEGIKKMGDIDIFAHLDGTIYLFDYTQISNRTVWPSDKHSSKMETLKNKFLTVSFECAVVSHSLPQLFWTMTFGNEPNLYGNYLDDFNKGTNILDVAGQLNHSECVSLLNHYSDNILASVDMDKTKLVRTLPTGKPAMLDSLKRYTSMVKHNGPLAAESFFKMRAALAAPNSHKAYSLDHFERIESCMEKPMFNYPLAARHPSLNNNNPFYRLKLIERTNTQLFMLTNPLISIIAMCEDNQIHPTKDEILILKKNPLYFKYEGITAQRVMHKNKKEYVNAVKLTFNGEIKSLCSLAYGDNKTKPLIEKSRTPKTCKTFIELEDQLKSELKWGSAPSSGSRYFDDLDPLIDNVMPDSKTSTLIREMMRSTLRTMRGSRLGSLMSQVQEVATSVCNAPRKKKICQSTHGGFHHKTCVVSLDCVTDRFLVSITNMSSTLNSNKDQTVTLAGVFNTELSSFARGHEQGLSEWFNYSAADLDWHVTLVHKLLSWVALEIEETLVNNKFVTRETLTELIMMPCLIMTINDQKFAQASEMVRYIFVN